jgi:MarR family transcriptional regulator, 2-MHQ and catechol-resistance regulon repressor
MPKSFEAADREALLALFARIDNQASVVATRALIRAAFLFTNKPDRPYHALGMNISEVDVLASVARAQGMALTCSEIAGATLITKGGITGILDRLEARGLVRREGSRDDRRSTVIQLTEKGADLCHRLFTKLARNDEDIFARALKPEQISKFSKLLAFLLGSLRRRVPRHERMHSSPATDMDEFEPNREVALVQSSPETNQGESAGPETQDGAFGLVRHIDGARADRELHQAR